MINKGVRKDILSTVGKMDQGYYNISTCLVHVLSISEILLEGQENMSSLYLLTFDFISETPKLRDFYKKS